MLAHLYNTYAVISNADWLTNNKRFCEAYAPNNHIKVLWRQIDDVVAYTDAGSTPYSTKQVVNNVYQLVFNTGIFAVDCREWNKRAKDDKMLPHIKFFSPPPTGSGAYQFKMRRVPPTAPRTMPPQTWTTGTSVKRRSKRSQTR